MKTKSLFFIASFFAAILNSSCEDWLTIEPQYEITDTDLYKNTAGYYKALNGLYYQMSGNVLYGKELSWGMVDVWSRYYEENPASDNKAYSQIYNLRYDDAELSRTAASIWEYGYNIIAQANDLIAHTEAAEYSFFTQGNLDKNTILGEAYAIRAIMHFDLMRVFGSSMKTSPDGKFVPYVDTYPSVVNPPIKNREFMDKVLADLGKAKELLKTLDVEISPNGAINPLDRFSKYSKSEFGPFFTMRGVRLNYYAVTILLARASLWAEKYEKALAAAKEITDITGTSKNSKLKLVQGYMILQSPKILDETMFGFYNEKLVESYEPYASLSNSMRLKIDDMDFFKTPGNDNRNYFVDKNSRLMQKYIKETGSEKDFIIPNVRLSEAFYIAAECLYKTDMKQASEMLMTIRKARGVSMPILSENTSAGDFEKVLIYEYRKEFVGEGQLLFFFKRKNLPISYSKGEFDCTENLIMPVPDSESTI